jgi:gas vesicle protein
MANGAGKFLGGILIGGTIGAAVGLLFAPRSGKETRQMLRKSADDFPKLAEEISSNVQYQADRFTETAQRTIDEAIQRLQEAIAVGQEASTKLRQELDYSGNPIQRNLRDATQNKEN